MLLRKQGSNQPRVWGSGFIRKEAPGEEPARLDVLAVRGRSTLDRMQNISHREIALGDPGILAPLLLDGPVKKRYALGLIPHYHDVNSPIVQRMSELGPEVRVINVAWTPQEVAREIASCDAVISSSLHGLIFSDALGVPNAHIRLGDRLKGGLYKFHDYYSAYPGEHRYREYVEPDDGPRSIRSVMDAVTQNYVEPTGLHDLQEGLVGALRDF
ncbi:polysaccharide pyruvyl transferase family protein [Brachybacterium alimentarium]|uniref:polysaccharide pyruvyl transferase family protein n=1 Tax=Brachybacterium alimentarium TaxID=47845 RepID=UPI003FD47D92